MNLGLGKSRNPEHVGAPLQTLGAGSRTSGGTLEDAAVGKMVQDECPVREGRGRARALLSHPVTWCPCIPSPPVLEASLYYFF